MTVHQYPADFSALDWTDLPSLSAGDTVDGGGATFTATLTCPTDGSDGLPIKFRNFTVDGAATLANCVSVAGKDFITLEGLYLDDATADGLVFGAPTADTDHLTLINVHVNGAAQDGFQFGHPDGGTCTNLIARGIRATNTGNTGLTLRNAPGALLSGVSVAGCGLTGSNTDGISIDDGSEGTILEDFEVSDHSSGQSVDIQDSIGSAAIIVRRGYIHSPGGATIDGLAMTGSAPCHAESIRVDGHRYNVLAKSTALHTINQLTSLNATEYGVRVGSATDGTLAVTNAIIDNSTVSAIRVQADISTTSTYTGDNNCFGASEDFHFGGVGNKTLAQWLTEQTGQDVSSIQTDPDLNAEGVPAFDSPAVGAGTRWWAAGVAPPLDVDGKRLASPPSIGAYERLGMSPRYIEGGYERATITRGALNGHVYTHDGR
jgi:hypothetical protein